MKDASLFFFEDDNSILFVRTPTPLHGGKGVLGCRKLGLVFSLEVALGVSRTLKLGETCSPSVCYALAHRCRGSELFGFALTRFALTSRRVLDLHRRRAVGRGVACTTVNVMGIIFRGKGHGSRRVWIGLASRDGGWLRDGDDGGHGWWTTGLEPTTTQCGLEERGSEEQNLLVCPVTKSYILAPILHVLPWWWKEWTHQNVVLSTTILTVPGSLPLRRVKVSSISMARSDSYRLSSVTSSSLSHSSRSHGGEPEERNMPAAAAWVSVGELSDAEGLLGPRELRAMRMWEGLVLSMLRRRSGGRQHRLTLVLTTTPLYSPACGRPSLSIGAASSQRLIAGHGHLGRSQYRFPSGPSFLCFGAVRDARLALTRGIRGNSLPVSVNAHITPGRFSPSLCTSPRFTQIVGSLVSLGPLSHSLGMRSLGIPAFSPHCDLTRLVPNM